MSHFELLPTVLYVCTVTTVSHGGLVTHWLAVVVGTDHVITASAAPWRLVLLSEARVVRCRYEQEQSLSTAASPHLNDIIIHVENIIC